ncbi:hypothetical protein CMMCAS06_05220 [Clavibacter michiganensis subsp. michiganensis]|nr:hypothetical protein CMMCAS06_05220 [Clavibacter michiganensis subsp. michiganensis]
MLRDQQRDERCRERVDLDAGGQPDLHGHLHARGVSVLATVGGAPEGVEGTSGVRVVPQPSTEGVGGRARSRHRYAAGSTGHAAASPSLIASGKGVQGRSARTSAMKSSTAGTSPTYGLASAA